MIISLYLFFFPPSIDPYSVQSMAFMKAVDGSGTVFFCLGFEAIMKDIYIYIYICVCVCVCVYTYKGATPGGNWSEVGLDCGAIFGVFHIFHIQSQHVTSLHTCRV